MGSAARSGRGDEEVDAGRMRDAANTKDLLDSRSLVYYSFTQTIDDSSLVYARCCVRPRGSYPQGGGEKELVKERKGFGRGARG